MEYYLNIRDLRIRWDEHIQMRDPDSILRNVGIREPAGRTPLGRPRIWQWDQLWKDTFTISASLD